MGSPITPVLVGDMRRCYCSSSKKIVEDGGQRHVVVVSGDRCGSTHLGTASCKEGLDNSKDFPAIVVGEPLYTFLQ